MFKAHVQDQGELFPPFIGDCVPDDDLARVVSEVVDRLDLSEFALNYSPLGQHAYSPSTMLKLIFYGYATGVRSSREIAAKVHDSVRFMWLAGRDRPGKSAIAEFRSRNTNRIEDLFIQIVRLCCRMGMVKLGLWSIDGTKLKANAGKNSLREQRSIDEELLRLRAEIRAALQEAAEADEEPDDDPPLPPSIRRKQDRQRRLEQALQTLKDNPGLKRANTTDPDAALMERKGGGFELSYNPQITVDADSQVALAADVCADTTDYAQLVPQINQAISNAGDKPAELTADAGYSAIPNLAAMHEQGITSYIAEQPDSNRAPGKFKREAFKYDEGTDSFLCPAGKAMPFKQTKIKDRKTGRYKARVYTCRDCEGCDLAARCLKDKAKSRSVEVSEHDGLIKQMRERLSTAEGKAAQAKRRQSVEPVFGVLKWAMSFRSFLLRGAKKVKAEWQLALAAFNIRKIGTSGKLKPQTR